VSEESCGDIMIRLDERSDVVARVTAQHILLKHISSIGHAALKVL
jgi:hypothetical protein